MTRINANLQVKLLSDEHLLAEHREIKRIPVVLQKSIKSGSINNIPESFRLGAGHVLFFLNKLQFVFNRYKEIHTECIKRGFNVEDYSNNFVNITDKSYWNDWECSPEYIKTVVERIISRINESNKQYFHYYGTKLNKTNYITLLKK